MTAHIIAWQPPEGCDVLAPTVGGGQAPRLCCIDGVWQAPGARQWWANTQPPSLLLQHAGQPVRAGMDAGRAVLGLGPLGVPLRSAEGYHLDDPRSLALLLEERIGGRAIVTDADGREIDAKGEE